jgi:hypothetical protein
MLVSAIRQLGTEGLARSTGRGRSMKKNKKKNKSRVSARKKFVPPRTAEELFALPDHLQDKYQRVTHAITRMRTDRLSLAEVSRLFGLNPCDTKRFGEKALRKQKNGRYAAKKRDRLLRPLMISSQRDLKEIIVNDSDQATRIAKHSNAVSLYLRTGDAGPLKEFEGQSAIDANGNRVLFLTDLKELDRRGSAGKLSFETLYARAS